MNPLVLYAGHETGGRPEAEEAHHSHGRPQQARMMASKSDCAAAYRAARRATRPPSSHKTDGTFPEISQDEDRKLLLFAA